MNLSSQTPKFVFRSTLTKTCAIAVSLSLACLQFLGCAASAPPDLGVTTGGQKDMASARTAIENGQIPDPDAITVEGLISEHSIDLEIPDKPGLLYMTASTAWNRDFDEFTPLATIQIGFGTTIDPTTFHRSLQNLCLVIDRSGSMNDPIDPRSGTTKLDAVKVAVDRLLGKLGVNDRVSVVAFDSRSEVILEPVFGNNIVAIKDAVDSIEPNGGTNLVAGLRAGYQLLQDNPIIGRTDRLLIFTDAELTRVQQNNAEDYIDVMTQYGQQGIGATIFGFGTDFGDDIAHDISQTPGANYFFIDGYDRLTAIFDDEFDFLVSPIAYDVALTVDVPYSFDVVDVYGIPVDADNLPNKVKLVIPALFLSNRQGGSAIFVRMRAGSLVNFAEQNTLGQLSLTYSTPEGERINNEGVTAILPAGLDSNADQSYFQSDAAKRATLLLNTALVLKRACEDATDTCNYDFWFGAQNCNENYSPSRAITRLTEFLPYFDNLAQGLEDRPTESSRALSEERAVVAKLLDNIKNWWGY